MDDAKPEPEPTTDDPADQNRGEDPGEGFVQLRNALVGLGLIWVTAMAVFGVIQSVILTWTTSGWYLLVGVVAAAIAVLGARATLKTFGYR